MRLFAQGSLCGGKNRPHDSRVNDAQCSFVFRAHCDSTDNHFYGVTIYGGKRGRRSGKDK